MGKRKRTGKIRLSQCMIVKNEEKNLEKALSWGRGIVCEQIVVDTGSTDRTVELAEKLGAKVYHFEWIDDFAAAKNFAIEKASGNWIAFLDADESINRNEALKLPEMLLEISRSEPGCCALLSDWIQLDDQGQMFEKGLQTRIFKNMPGLRYEGRIHETLMLNGGKKHVMDVTGHLAVVHIGYGKEMKSQGEKELRNRKLILQELSEQPDNYDMMGYVGDTYYSEGNLEDAERWYSKAIESMPDRLEEYDLRSSRTFTELMKILILKGNEEKLGIIYNLGVNRLPFESDFDFLMGRYYTNREEYGRGSAYLERAISLLEQYGSVNRGRTVTENVNEVWELLALCYYRNHQLAECVTCCVKVLKEDRFNSDVLFLLLNCFREEEKKSAAGRPAASADQVLTFLAKLYDFTAEKDLDFVRDLAFTADYHTLKELLALLLSDLRAEGNVKQKQTTVGLAKHGNDEIRISQCMIVKNEEKNMEKALSWGKGIVWEQIVVDTGSTDRTVELAERLGAKVYHFEWMDDFSAAKNFAIERAEGNWIAFLDADEYFTAEESAKVVPLLERVQGTEYNVLVSNLLNTDDDGKLFCGGTQARLFRNIPGLRYRGRIHESLTLWGSKNVKAVDLSEDLAIIHTGYGKEASGHGGKGARNREIILKELSDHPDDYDMMGNLGDALLAEGKMEEAENWFYKAIELMPEHPDELDSRSAMTFTKLIGILIDKDNEADLHAVYKTAIGRLPQEADFDFYVGRYYTLKERYEEGAYYLQRAINLLEQYGSLNKSMAISVNLASTWELLALCYYKTGQLSPCVKCCVTLLKAEKYAGSPLLLLLRAFMEDERKVHPAGQRAANVDEVAAFLDKLYDFSNLKDRMFLLKIAEEAEYKDMVSLVRETFTPEELAFLDQSMEKLL
ncbi:glycosyltransferase [Hungatella hathewayi]|uniref:glycosyltransferase n=1 Tax=Hungatella hathewayi TaxID=154046 RepID=UPI0035643876